MGLRENNRVARVNRSSSNIPVYGQLVHSEMHVSGITAGGERIGTIYPNEFYTVIPNDSRNVSSWEIRFRNSAGVMATGYIETSPGISYEDYAWSEQQEPYHYYNSNGSTLVAAGVEQIDGKVYYVFEIQSAAEYREPSGNLKGALPAGTRLATTGSVVGQAYPGYMLFNKRNHGNGWVDVCDSGYGFVNLCLSKGSMPSNRAIY